MGEITLGIVDMNFDNKELLNIGLMDLQIQNGQVIHEKHGNVLYRIKDDGKNYILKIFAQDNDTSEIDCYSLLKELNVPILEVMGFTDHLLYMEDILENPSLRLGEACDLEKEEVGRAIAVWYKTLHSKGKEFLKKNNNPIFLKREVEMINSEILEQLGKRFKVLDNKGWKLAIDNINELKNLGKDIEETILYNDFNWTNLCIEINNDKITGAFMFDYHLMSRGLAYSDVRNVLWMLEGRAKEAFIKEYGQINNKEKEIDEIISTIITLIGAAEREIFPSWGQDVIMEIESGEFEKKLLKIFKQIN